MAEVIRSIRFSKKFKKQYKKLTAKQQKQFDSRFELWQENPDHPLLRRHQLSGKLKRLYSIDITGDIRVLYEIVGDQVFVYQLIGSHSELYG